MTAEAAHVAAVVAALAAGGSSAYGVADLSLMTTKPTHYNEVHVMLRSPEGARLSGINDVRFHRVLIRSVGQRYRDAQDERDIIDEALVGAYLTVGGRETTVISRALSEDPIGLDDNWYSGTTELSYAL